MSRHFFDVQNTGSAKRDDNGLECADRGAVEARVRQLAHDNADKHDGGRAPLTISVLNDSHKILLTALVACKVGLQIILDH